MRVYIHTDIEGCAGWCFYASIPATTQANLEHTARMNKLLTAEVVAACKAALDSGADEVWVNDAHGPAYSINFEDLPSKCQIIHGRPAHFDQWLGCFNKDIDAMVCIGQHAMSGTPHSVCPHSMWHVNDDIKLSETTMAAALAGEFGVPTVCVSGDDKIAAECAQKIPGIETAVVKWGISAQNARSLCPADACELIYEKVKRGLARRDEIKPFVLNGPFRLNLSDRDPAVRVMPNDNTGDNLSELFHRTLNEIYANYGQDPLDDRSFRYPT